MKKLTQILNLFNTSNFLDETNKEGKIIDFGKNKLFQIIPEAGLQKTIQSLNGQIVITEYSTKLFLDYNFEAGTINTSILDSLPPILNFYLVAKNQEKVTYSGLNFNRQMLCLAPLNTPQDYTFNTKKVTCNTCGKAKVISESDLVSIISTTPNLSEIQKLIEKPIGTKNEPIDLKAEIGSKSFNLKNKVEMNAFYELFKMNQFKKVAINFKRKSDNSVLKTFTELLVVGDFPQNTVGLISIPKSQLTINVTDQSKYENLNNFIAHLPNQKAKVNLTLNLSAFESGTKLFLDQTEIVNPPIIAHPEIPNFKQIKSTINDYLMLLNKPKLIAIQTAQKKNYQLPINPMNNFDFKTKVSTINITKQLT